ncbi:divergent polysaccharide deacetylase family protein [Pontivivens ytuae]|uniref:Divergent polysaccharide deacetylase family protein n=1 Tax=Pontivivens ytuae TaxID=2789856 RepID=A0A7S9LSN0_9RHOB|nr:divergent polysaccharide deacetylase family protein [Pontivivens ytuae]QPH53955.1 divergent polysaccharide deacetylase family protein [Pontivivens ytuae]
MAMASGGGSFLSGFFGGLVVSAAAFVGLTIAIPPQVVEPAAPVEVAIEQAPPPDTPQFPEVISGEATPSSQSAPDQPSASGVPTEPAPTPAVDPPISQREIALAPIPLPESEITAESGAPRPSSSSTGGVTIPSTSSALDAPETAVVNLSASSASPSRPRAGTGAPGRSLGLDTPTTGAPNSLPRASATGSLSRPPVASIQPEAGATSSDPTPQAPEAAAPPPSLPDADPVTEAVAQERSPLRLNAARFNDPGGRALLSVVLVDLGEDQFPISTLDNLSLPVTIAIPADLPNAAQRAAAFRSAGVEVLAMIPEGTLGDLNTLDTTSQRERLAEILAAVPQAVGLIDRTGGVVSSSTATAQAVVDYVELSGHALLVQPSIGLTQPDRLAEAANVPAATISRVLDASEGVPAMQNALQRVAVDARSTGSSVVMGNSDAATITTLLTWAITSGNREIALAPVSAVVTQ